MSRKLAILTVAVTFEGDYYDLDEIVDVASNWIYAGFEDRDDLRGTTIDGKAYPLAPEADE